MFAGVMGAIGGAVLVLLVLPAELFGRSPIPSGTVAADAQLVSVIDGETLKLRDTVIRLEGITAPPRGHACRTASGMSYDCGAAATEALADLVRGHAVQCQLNGRDNAGYPQAICQSGGTALNRALVLAGWARAQNAQSAGAQSSGTQSSGGPSSGGQSSGGPSSGGQAAGGPVSFGPEEADARTGKRGFWRDGRGPTF
jgi:endonuclease YncB( thermonuclease family)